MNWLRLIAVVAALIPAVAAAQRDRPARRLPPPPSTAQPVHLFFDFSLGALGWKTGFADNNPHFSEDIVSEVRLLPPELGSSTAWYLSGWNRSDDLFLYMARPVSGLVPGHSYVADFAIRFASNVGPQCAGVGGAPGESVYLKAGVSPFRPRAVADREGVLRMNVDKGNQSAGGVHASTAGTISAPNADCGGISPFRRVERDHLHPFAMPASAWGELWLIFGFDSGFESFSSIYVERIEVRLTPVAADHASARWQILYAAMAEVVGDIRALGISLYETSRGEDPLIGARVIHHLIEREDDREELYFYMFDSDAAARQASASFAADGSAFGTVPLDWRLPPHLYLGDQTIVAYVGSSAQILSVLTSRYGPQFAGQ